MKYVLLLAVFAFSFQTSHSQLLKKIKESRPLANITEGKKPITTNFKDVDLDGRRDPSFGENETYTPLHSMKKMMMMNIYLHQVFMRSPILVTV